MTSDRNPGSSLGHLFLFMLRDFVYTRCVGRGFPNGIWVITLQTSGTSRRPRATQSPSAFSPLSLVPTQGTDTFDSDSPPSLSTPDQSTGSLFPRSTVRCRHPEPLVDPTTVLLTLTHPSPHTEGSSVFPDTKGG